jgi:hypothetical protein
MDRDLFPNRKRYPRFDVSELLRADWATTASVIHQLKQVGTITANEGRAYIGLPPRREVPGGDVLQVTPVGGAPNADERRQRQHGRLGQENPHERKGNGGRAGASACGRRGAASERRVARRVANRRRLVHAHRPRSRLRPRDRALRRLGWWRLREKIARGAFTKVLASKPDVHLNIGHDMNRAIARTGVDGVGGLELTEDDQSVCACSRGSTPSTPTSSRSREDEPRHRRPDELRVHDRRSASR